MASSDSTDPNVPSANGRCHIDRLPPELRLIIYDYFLSDYKLNLAEPSPPMLSTCHLIRKEATDAYLVWLTNIDEETEGERSRRFWARQARLDEIQHDTFAGNITTEESRELIKQVKAEQKADWKKYKHVDRVVLGEMDRFESEQEAGILGDRCDEEKLGEAEEK